VKSYVRNQINLSWAKILFTSVITPGRTVALVSTQPLTEIRTSEGGRCVGLTNVLPSNTDSLEIVEAPASWASNGLFRSVRTGICNSFVPRVQTWCE
jgi:hypothetical protein